MTSYRVRPAAVAGTFYPATAHGLAATVRELMQATQGTGRAPAALIVPHAGYRFSGLVAARAFRELIDSGLHPARIVLLGPSHRVPVDGLVAPTASAFATPLGDVHVDQEAIDALVSAGLVERSKRAHAAEHSLEVQLPFLQQALGDFLLVPLLIGGPAGGSVDVVLDRLADDETLVVASSDLSHYHHEAEARRRDHRTLQRVLALDTALEAETACGCHAINALDRLARARGWTPELLGYCNSADSGGDREHVVGYGALAMRHAA